MFFKNNTLQKLLLGLNFLVCVQNDCAAQRETITLPTLPERPLVATHEWNCTEIESTGGQFILGETFSPDHHLFSTNLTENPDDIINLFKQLMSYTGLCRDYPLTARYVGLYADGTFRIWTFISNDVVRPSPIFVGPLSPNDLFIQIAEKQMARFAHQLPDGRVAIGLMLERGGIHRDSILDSPMEVFKTS